MANDHEAYKAIQAAHGKRGGQTTFKRIGKKGMSALAKKRWAKNK